MPEQTSIWRKEIHLGRKRETAAAVVAVEQEGPAVEPAAEENTLILEPARDVPQHGDARMDAAKAVVAAARNAAKTDTATSPAPNEQPWWKKEVNLRRTAPVQKPRRTPKPTVARDAKLKPVEPAPAAAPKAASPKRLPKPKLTIPKPKLNLPKPQVRSPKASARASKPGRQLRLPKPQLRVSIPNFGGLGARRATASSHKLVGLRIGSSQLAAAVVNNNGTAELLQLVRAPLASGVVSAGEVRDPEALGQALKAFFAGSRLPRRGVRLGVATNRIGVRVLEVPAADDPRTLANAIRFRAQEVLPFALTDAVLDHVVLGDAFETDEGMRQRVLVVFAQRELIDGYVEACKRAGIRLTGIDFDAFALLRALSQSDDRLTERKAALVAVAIGHDRTIFAVSDGETCEFARVLDWGGANLDAALARAFDIAVDEAEKLKLELAETSEPNDKAREVVQRELNVLARELLSSLQFYQSRPGSLAIGEVLLTGGCSQLAGIDEELARHLGVPVQIGDPLSHVTLGRKLEKPGSAASLAIAVGLGIDR